MEKLEKVDLSLFRRDLLGAIGTQRQLMAAFTNLFLLQKIDIFRLHKMIFFTVHGTRCNEYVSQNSDVEPVKKFFSKTQSKIWRLRTKMSALKKLSKK